MSQELRNSSQDSFRNDVEVANVLCQSRARTVEMLSKIPGANVQEAFASYMEACTDLENLIKRGPLTVVRRMCLFTFFSDVTDVYRN